jgi:hypothetical protein
MSDMIKNNINVNINTRFSNEQSISNYTSVVYELTPEEVIKSGGVTCVGKYCVCLNKSKCNCLLKLKTVFNK